MAAPGVEEQHIRANLVRVFKKQPDGSWKGAIGIGTRLSAQRGRFQSASFASSDIYGSVCMFTLVAGEGEFVLLLALTFPLSVILFLLNDLLVDVNAFHMTGWPYFITLCALGAGALLNARMLCLLDAFVRRKWCDA